MRLLFFFLKKNTQKNPSNILLVGLRNTRAQLPVTGGRRLLAPQLELWVPGTTSRPRSCPSVCVPRLGGGSAAEIGLHQPAPLPTGMNSLFRVIRRCLSRAGAAHPPSIHGSKFPAWRSTLSVVCAPSESHGRASRGPFQIPLLFPQAASSAAARLIQG